MTDDDNYEADAKREAAELCDHCSGTGMESTDPEDASKCLDCDGTGKKRPGKSI